MGMVVLADAFRYRGFSTGLSAVTVDSVEIFSINLGLVFPPGAFVLSDDKLSADGEAGRKTLQAVRLRSKISKMN
jgi:hypothetical protein